MLSSVNTVHGAVRKILAQRRPPPEGLLRPPLLSGGLPLAGHTVEFVRDTIGLLARAQRELGEVAAVQVGPKRMVAMFGPDAHEAVFRAPDRQLSPNEAYKIMTPVFGKDIVYDAAPARMTEQLKMLLPALRDRRMRTYGETILSEVQQSIADWGDEGVVDIVDYCRVLTNFTSSHCLLGSEFRNGMTDEFARVYHDLERGVTPIAYLNANLPIPSFRKRDKARVRLVQMIEEIINARRRSGHRGEDFLQTLMDARYKTGERLSSHEITGMLLAGLFAGHHTSSVTTAWTLIELLQNPSYMERVLAQLDSVYDADEAVSYQSLREITATDNAVREALRLHPPLFMLVRVAQQDFRFKRYHIPQGTWILISPTVAHQIDSIFAHPARFDPDRFAPPREEDKRDFAYIPFGGGRHKCLGNAFALLQVKAILAVLLRRYEFELSGDPIGSDFHGLVVGPREPCRLRYRRRARRTGVVVNEMAPRDAAPAPGCPMHAGSASAEPGSSTTDRTSGAKDNGANGANGTNGKNGVNGANGVNGTNGKNGVNSASDARDTAGVHGCPMHTSGGTAPSHDLAATRTLRIVLDRDLCQGHSVCMGEAPEVFRVGEGKVELIMDAPSPELHQSVLAAEKYCPNGVIRVHWE